MKLKIDPKFPRRILDEHGNELFVFVGIHLEDLRQIIAKVNNYEGKGYSKKDVAI